MDAVAKPLRKDKGELLKIPHPQGVQRFVKTESPEVLVAKMHTRSTHPGGKKGELGREVVRPRQLLEHARGGDQGALCTRNGFFARS